MRGKYSPTVSAAYQKNRNWFDQYAQGNQYDPEGFDAYGYDKDDQDRAGYFEHEYYNDDYRDDGLDGFVDGSNAAYEHGLEAWGFDGVKPALRVNSSN